MERKTSKSRLIAGAVAGAAAFTLLLTGTFAYIDNDQHKTNALRTGQNISVTLNDDFKPPADWVPGTEVNKDVSVTNLATSDSAIFVRLQFKEYLEFFPQVLIVDSEDNPLLFATYASGAKIGQYMLWSEKPAGYDYTKYTVDGVDYCLTQNSELKDGIYGKPMYEKGALNVFGTATKASYPAQDHSIQKTDECDYNVTKWNGTTRVSGIKDQNGTGTSDIANYISWTMDADVVSMADWINGTRTLGDFWIIDTDGWMYWANPLEPGETTANVMDAVTLTQLPNHATDMEYYIHIDMETCTGNEFENGQWGDASMGAQDLIRVFLGDVANAD